MLQGWGSPDTAQSPGELEQQKHHPEEEITPGFASLEVQELLRQWWMFKGSWEEHKTSFLGPVFMLTLSVCWMKSTLPEVWT